MAAAIKSAIGVDCEMIQGSGGVFDVVADGKTIYSKHETDRFPTDDEVLASLKSL